MRVAYLCLDAGIPLRGSKGASNHVREFCAELESQGHDVELFSARVGKGDECLPRVVHSVGRPTSSGLDTMEREKGELDRNHGLETLLREAHRGNPFDLIYERYSLWSFVANDLAREWDIPYVLEVNSPLRREQAEHRRIELDEVAARVEKQLFGQADLVVCVSPAVADYVRSVRGRGGEVLTVPNGVDLALFPAMPHEPRDDGAFVIGFVGSLKPWHGIETLLAAFNELAEQDGAYRLLVVGDGPKRSDMQSFVRSHGLDARVEFTGGVSKNRISALLRRMDVAVAPYEQLDGFYFSPLKLFEYMAAGAAIVASRIGQIGEIIEHGETGLLTEPGDPADLAAQIHRARLDNELRRRLGAQARARAFAEHGWGRRVQTIIEAAAQQRTALAEATR